MSQDCDTMPKSRKHQSTSKPAIKENRKTFWEVSESSSFSSNGNSPAQSNDEYYYLKETQIKNITEEEKDDMLKKLQCQVKELRHKLRILEDCIENKDCAIGTVTREKDRIMGEIRRLERSNKQLRQQLNDERNHYMEEKEKFCEEMTKFKKRLQEMKMAGDNRYLRSPISVASKINAGMWQKGDCAEVNPTVNASGNILSGDSEFRKSTSASGITLYQGQDLSLQMAALRTENAKLKSIITDREERNYELCLRFLRMKCSKNDLRNRFQDLEQEYLQVITNLMEKIDEARDEFNFIIDQKFKKPLRSTNANYIRMVQKNSKIIQENITLRMEIQSMKKQLSKGNFGQGDCARKPDEAKKSSSDSRTKNITKLVGIKQMKSEGNLPPRASDTDSNYMSKTPTTDPSTSTIGGKSSESTIESVNVKSKAPKTNNKLFSDDILQKIFEFVDTQSNSGIHSEADEKNSTLQKLGIKYGKLMEQKDLNGNSPEGTGKRYVECTLNAKNFHEITLQETTKKTGTTIATSKEKVEPPKPEEHMEKKASDEIRKPRKKISNLNVKSKNKSLYNMQKECTPPFTDKDRLEEKENINLRDSFRFKAERNRVHQFDNQRKYKSKKERHQKLFLGDYCGLEENLKTDEDTSPDNDSEMQFLKRKTGKYNNELAMLKYRLSDSIQRKVSHEIQTKENDTNSDDSAIGSSGAKPKNRNSISLHDELMEATKSLSQTDDPFWRRELNLHSLITKKSTASSRTYRLGTRKSQFLSGGNKTPHVMDEDDGENVHEIGVGTLVDDGSRSISPIWRNKAGSEKDSPLNLADKTSANPLVMTDSEVVLHFLMPPATILSTQSFLYDENCKEGSLQSGKGQKSVSNSARELMNQASNVPSSCTTAELTESTVVRENGLTSRTFSAPALIESDWFNNFKMCEMKDCSTNT